MQKKKKNPKNKKYKLVLWKKKNIVRKTKKKENKKDIKIGRKDNDKWV